MLPRGRRSGQSRQRYAPAERWPEDRPEEARGACGPCLVRGGRCSRPAEAAAGRVAGTAARHRQQVSASAWLIAPQVGQMTSRMLMPVGVGRSGPELSPERGFRREFRDRARPAASASRSIRADVVVVPVGHGHESAPWIRARTARRPPDRRSRSDQRRAQRAPEVAGEPRGGHHGLDRGGPQRLDDPHATGQRRIVPQGDRQHLRVDRGARPPPRRPPAGSRVSWNPASTTRPKNPRVSPSAGEVRPDDAEARLGVGLVEGPGRPAQVAERGEARIRAARSRRRSRSAVPRTGLPPGSGAASGTTVGSGASARCTYGRPQRNATSARPSAQLVVVAAHVELRGGAERSPPPPRRSTRTTRSMLGARKRREPQHGTREPTAVRARRRAKR